MIVKMYVSHDNVPRRATEMSSGYDLSSSSEAEIIIQAGNSQKIPTGVYISMPFGLEAQVRSRSGLAAKKNVFVLNSPGTIDADYRGEIQVILFNLGKENFIVKKGDKIAQLVFANIVAGPQTHRGTNGITGPTFMTHDLISLVSCVEELGSTERGAGGFGSTGVGLNEVPIPAPW